MILILLKFFHGFHKFLNRLSFCFFCESVSLVRLKDWVVKNFEAIIATILSQTFVKVIGKLFRVSLFNLFQKIIQRPWICADFVFAVQISCYVVEYDYEAQQVIANQVSYFSLHYKLLGGFYPLDGLLFGLHKILFIFLFHSQICFEFSLNLLSFSDELLLIEFDQSLYFFQFQSFGLRFFFFVVFRNLFVHFVDLFVLWFGQVLFFGHKVIKLLFFNFIV